MATRAAATAAGLAATAAGLSACTRAGSAGGQAAGIADEGLPTAETDLRTTTGFYFDTVCQVSAAADEEVLAGALGLCETFENLFSRTREGSDIWRVNAAQGAAVAVAPQTCDLVSRALPYCEAAGGIFDITIGAVSELWDFKQGVVPAPQAIAAALPHVDWRGVQVDAAAGTVLLADPAARLDLGGIAKGYIADALVDWLRGQGVQSACVNLGGNVKTLGIKPDGSPWRVGVQDPEDPSGIVAVLEAANPAGASVVTSGLYERVFEKDGRRWWHILDPRTGYPVETQVAGATIASAASLDGDGFTKPLFMWPQEHVEAFFQEHPELQGYLVYMDGTEWMSPGAAFDLQ